MENIDKLKALLLTMKKDFSINCIKQLVNDFLPSLECGICNTIDDNTVNFIKIDCCKKDICHVCLNKCKGKCPYCRHIFDEELNKENEKELFSSYYNESDDEDNEDEQVQSLSDDDKEKELLSLLRKQYIKNINMPESLGAFLALGNLVESKKNESYYEVIKVNKKSIQVRLLKEFTVLDKGDRSYHYIERNIYEGSYKIKIDMKEFKDYKQILTTDNKFYYMM